MLARPLLTMLLIAVLMGCSESAMESPGRIQLAETLVIGTSTSADDGFAAHLRDDVVPAWNADHPRLLLHAFRADRGEEAGAYLLAFSSTDLDAVTDDALSAAGLTGERAPEMADANAYTAFELVGAETAGPLPAVELLGIHRVQIIPERAGAFDAFVRDTVYPTFEDRAPGMRLLYYKGVRGAEVGDYILLFTFDTVQRREDYFPTGQPETEALTGAFAPMAPVGDSLATYQVEGTYLDRSSNLAAAMFEAVDWTDYAHLGAPGAP